MTIFPLFGIGLSRSVRTNPSDLIGKAQRKCPEGCSRTKCANKAYVVNKTNLLGAHLSGYLSSLKLAD